MSIIERSNPLNLQYNICLVTSASSPLGVRVCKSLLKANALVLGIDNTDRDPTLNAGLGTHFQFEECDITDGSTAAKVVAAAKEKFGLARIDVLVNVVDHSHQKDLSGFQKLTEEATAAMKLQGKGSVITLTNDVESDPSAELIDFAKDIASQHQSDGIRCNLISPQPSGGGETESAKAFGNAREHMTYLLQSKEEASKLHEVGMLSLFLAGDMGVNIAGRVVRLDGSSSPL